MMYMSGGGIQIFSIMSVWFLLKQAVGGMFSVDKGPSLSLPDLQNRDLQDLRLQRSHLSRPLPRPSSRRQTNRHNHSCSRRSSTFSASSRSSYALSPLPTSARNIDHLRNTAQCVGLWKTNSMGLLPTSREDWAPFYGAFSSSSAAADVAAAAAAATFAPFVPAPDPIGVGFEAFSGVGVPA